jgi:hypothetical protein
MRSAPRSELQRALARAASTYLRTGLDRCLPKARSQPGAWPEPQVTIGILGIACELMLKALIGEKAFGARRVRAVRARRRRVPRAACARGRRYEGRGPRSARTTLLRGVRRLRRPLRRAHRSRRSRSRASRSLLHPTGVCTRPAGALSTSACAPIRSRGRLHATPPAHATPDPR